MKILGYIFSEEEKNKNRRAIEKQIGMSGLPMKRGFEDLDFSFQSSFNKRQIRELRTMRFLENAENIISASREWAKSSSAAQAEQRPPPLGKCS